MSVPVTYGNRLLETLSLCSARFVTRASRAQGVSSRIWLCVTGYIPWHLCWCMARGALPVKGISTAGAVRLGVCKDPKSAYSG